MNTFKRKIVLAIAAIWLCIAAKAQTTNLKVDHRYSPEWWQSLICQPDDPVKTLVGKEGQIFGDYGYDGGPRFFSFSMGFDTKTPAVWKSQHLVSQRGPMLLTTKESDGVEITEKTFLEIPGDQKLNTIVRYDSRRVERGWSKPSVDCDPAFNDVAMGLKGLSGEGLVEFQVKVAPQSAFHVALGFCEGELDTAARRVMRITVEGAAYKDIDPVKDAGRNKPIVYFLDAKDVNGDGILNIIVTNKPGALIRNAFINGLWLFKDAAPSSASIIDGKENSNAALYVKCADVKMPVRKYEMLVTLSNKTNSQKTIEPVIRYSGTDPIKKEGKVFRIGDHSVLSASNDLLSISGDSAKQIAFNKISLKPGEQKQMVIALDRFDNPGKYIVPTVASAAAALNKTIAWWQKNSPSADAIKVPDAGVQSIVEASLRNIMQARELRKGNKSFHVGPTIYRGLWIADGTFLLETATMLDYVKDVRSCISYLEGYQLPTGGFEMITTFHKENGLVLFMLTRHAFLTQDKQWLNENWSVIEGCIKRINYLRDEAMKDPSKPYYTLLPNGNVDGGIQHGNDYSNTEWCLSGMKWAIRAARWLGKAEQAETWQREYDDFYAKFLKLAIKDVRKDDKGNDYLPVLINNEQNQAPQKGQWAFCQSVYPGTIFDDNDTALQIAKSTVEMLHDHREEGLVINTGWMEQGLWTYFSSFYGHALQWLGRGKELPQLLYDYGNHSSPTMVWREEQKPQGKGNEEVGDMPHNWASAEFIRMVVHMIQLDHGKELHLFEGLPKQWTRPNAETKLTGIRTPFGRINLSFRINRKGDAANLDIQFLDKTDFPEKIVVHKESWNEGAENEVIAPAAHIQKTISIQ
jgi:hypothetical protein